MYWDHTAGAGLASGLCRRYAPGRALSGTDLDIEWAWQETDPDSWCGEHHLFDDYKCYENYWGGDK